MAGRTWLPSALYKPLHNPSSLGAVEGGFPFCDCTCLSKLISNISLCHQNQFQQTLPLTLPSHPPTMSQGIYRSLSDGQIRLIRLLPGRSDEEIKCRLETYYLGTPIDPGKLGCPPYETLSYVWGDPSDTRKILVDKEYVAITKNLFNALRVLRKVNGHRMIWADALCIDQANGREKAKQVAFMGKSTLR